MLTVKVRVFERASQVWWINKSFWGCVPARGLVALTMGLAFRNRVYWGLTGSICQKRGRASLPQACQAGGKDFKLKMPGEGNLSPYHSYQLGDSVRHRCPEPEEGSQVSRKASEEQHKGIPVTPASKSASLGSQLQSTCAILHMKGNKQEELEMWACLWSHRHVMDT